MVYMHNVYSQTRVLLCSPGYPQTHYPLPQLPESAITGIHITVLTESWVLLFHWSTPRMLWVGGLQRVQRAVFVPLADVMQALQTLVFLAMQQILGLSVQGGP